MINWHHEPAAQALLSQLNASRVERVKRIAIPADYYVYVAVDDDAREILDQLENLRTTAIERTLGCSFMEAAEDRSRHDEIMGVLEAALDVSVVVGEAL